MHSQFMDTQDVVESAFLDELSKIAEAHREDSKWITKGKLKRLLTGVVPAAAVGTALGYGSMKAVEALRRKYRWPIAEGLVKKVGISNIRKAMPYIGVGGALGLVGGGLLALKAMHTKNYLEGKHERSK